MATIDDRPGRSDASWRGALLAGRERHGLACARVSRSIMGLATSSSSSSSIVAGSRDGNVLDYELREQKARTLGNLDSQVERALAALRAFDAAPHGADGEGRRRALLDQAADRV